MPRVSQRNTKKSKDQIVVKVKKLSDKAVIPSYKTEGAAAFDLTTIEDIDLLTLNAYDKALKVNTGLAFEIPKGYHMKVFLRSSIGLNTPLRLANGTGIIDSDYRWPLILLVENIGRFPVRVPAGTRIAQGIIEKNEDVIFEQVEELEDTQRGIKGFGSTGVN